MSKSPEKDKAKESAEVTRIAKPRHEWIDEGYIHRDSTPSGCEEHERRCKHCGLVRITVHAPEGYPPRAFRTKGGIRFPDPGYTPVCGGGGK